MDSWLLGTRPAVKGGQQPELEHFNVECSMVIAAAPAQLLRAEGLQFACGKGLQGIAHRGLPGIVIDRDARSLALSGRMPMPRPAAR